MKHCRSNTRKKSPLQPFVSANHRTPWLDDVTEKHQRKLCADLDEAIRKSGLRDGMTISFHHAFREGDKVINHVVDTLARLGFKDLTLASSSLMTCNAPLIEHIRNGVISRIYTSGMRGKLADAISHGLMKEPVQIHSHGGRVHLLQSGELTIDVAFLGVPSSDEFGNANGTSGKSRCGSLGYAMVDAHYAKKSGAADGKPGAVPEHAGQHRAGPGGLRGAGGGSGRPGENQRGGGARDQQPA
ncbi:hypothetical protein OS31_48940 [Dickeya oryzae]